MLVKRLRERLRGHFIGKELHYKDEEIRKLKEENAALSDTAAQRDLSVGFCIVLLEEKGTTTFTIDKLNHLSATRKLCWFHREGIFVLEVSKIDKSTNN